MSTALKLVTLEQLCQPLNVDVELTDDDIEEMQTKITDLESELDDLKTDHESLKESVEQNNESIADFKAWLSGQFESNNYTSIEVCIDDILHEYKKTISTISI